jgi:phosphate transport system permease protein
MSAFSLARPGRRGSSSSLRGKTLRPAAVWLCVAVAFAVMAGVFAISPWQGVVDYIVAGAVAAVVLVTAVSWVVEGGRWARNRLAASLVWLCMLLMALPLVFVIGYTVDRGLKRFGAHFLTHDMTGIGLIDAGGGVGHAIIGTLEQVGIATAISVPLALLVAIYVTEYGQGALAFSIRFMIDVMTGIPSIVAGLFILAFWVLALHRGFSGLAGALALAIVELPIITRTAEEMILLVPSSLREASYALGVARWKTILHIVLPTASTGIVTGIMLAVARVMGETAPILLVVGSENFYHVNPANGPQASLPLFVYRTAGSSSQFDIDRAWAAALTLILLVVILYAGARLLTRRNALAQR